MYWNNFFNVILTLVLSQYGRNTIEGLHVTSYQAKFASSHTCDRHVGFLFARDGIGKHNCYFLFSSYHITYLQHKDKKNTTHNRLKFQILPWSKSKVRAVFRFVLLCCCFSPYSAVQKGNQEMLQNRALIGTYYAVQTLYLVSALLVLFCMARARSPKNASSLSLFNNLIYLPIIHVSSYPWSARPDHTLVEIISL